MIIIDAPQLSEEWFAARAEIGPTASNFDKIVTSKGLPSKQAQKYLYERAGERIAGFKGDSYQSFAMQRGIELEEEARSLFELIHGIEVKQVGFCMSDDKTFGCSPDGLLEDSGLEIKCPLIHTHVDYLLSGELPSAYIQQVQGSMLVTGFKYYWFISYYPGLPPLIIRVERDTEFLIKLKVALDNFCVELNQVESKLRGMS